MKRSSQVSQADSQASRRPIVPLGAKGKFLALFCCLSLASCGGGGGGSGASGTQRFEVIFENIATSLPIVTSSGAQEAVVFSPFVIAIHNSPAPIFTLGVPARANGLEAFAEDGDAQGLLTALQSVPGVSLLAFAATPVGTSGTSLLGPGSSYRSVIQASPGESISFVSSYVQANDLIVSTPSSGVSLFDANGMPSTLDLTSQLQLIDIGTELNEEPGAGPNQVLRQPTENSGQATNAPVAPVSDGFQYPPLPSALRVSIRPF